MTKLIVFDIDGTLTSGKIIYSDTKELKEFDVKDGLAIATWTKKLGKSVAVITGRNSKVVQKRLEELGAKYIYQGVDNKDEILETILEKENISLDEVSAIGDDLNDYKMLSKVGKSFAPNDAVEDIKEIVDVVIPYGGGKGAARYMIEYILENDYNTSLKELWV